MGHDVGHLVGAQGSRFDLAEFEFAFSGVNFVGLESSFDIV